ncbi:MAG: LemA family protein, partial [Parcubacteria group bacterium]
MPTTLIIMGAIVLILLWAIFAYNSFVRLINRAKEAWADIDVQLKRRYDLIPNLINTVKGYGAHEKELLENVTKARADAISAEQTGDPKKSGAAENILT